MEVTFWTVSAVLLSTILSDIVWAYYFIKVAQKKPHQAAFFAILIALNSSFITISYIGNMYFLIPVIIGSYIGTYIAVKGHIKYDKSDEALKLLQVQIEQLETRLSDMESNFKGKYE